MARQIKTIDYDADNDILFISDGEKVMASLDIGDFVLDVSHNNFICGIEIIDASENLGISKEMLENIQGVKLSVLYRANNVNVLLMISFKKDNKEVNVPIPLTIDLGHVSTKREVLVYQ